MLRFHLKSCRAELVTSFNTLRYSSCVYKTKMTVAVIKNCHQPLRMLLSKPGNHF